MQPPPSLTPPHLYVFYAVLLAWGLSELLGRYRYRAAPEQRDDRGSYRVLQVAVLLATAVAFGAAFFLDATRMPRPLLAFWVGLGVLAVGLLVRRVAMWTLDDRFSYRVSVRPDHEIVDRGPYRWVRHPSYTGGALGYLGIGIALGDWLAVLALALASAVGYGYRIRVEETVLRERLGEAYDRYAERTPYRLVPWVW